MAGYDFQNNFPDFTNLLTSLKTRMGNQQGGGVTLNPDIGGLTQPSLGANINMPALPTANNMNPSIAAIAPQSTANPVNAAPSFGDKLSAGLKDPTTMALLKMGMSMLSTPPRRVKYGAGEIIGNSAMQGLDAFQQASAANDATKRTSAIDAMNADMHKAQIGHLNSEAAVNAAKMSAPQETMIDVPGIGKMKASDAWHYFQSDKPVSDPIPDVLADQFKLPKGTTFDQVSKIAPLLKPPTEKNETDNQLIRISLFDKDPEKRKQAQSVLDAEEKRKLKIAKEGRAIITESKATLMNNYHLNPTETKTIQDAIAEGRLNADRVNSRTAKMYAQVLGGERKLDFNNSAAAAGAQKKVETLRSQTESFERTASKNFDLVERLYDKNPQGTVYVLNQLKTNINTKITGDPETVALGRSIKTALMEYAKVVTGQTQGAAVSDSARVEVATLLSQADKPEAFHSSIANHRIEMNNRMEGFQETIDQLKVGRGGNVRTSSTPQQVGRFTIEVE